VGVGRTRRVPFQPKMPKPKSCLVLFDSSAPTSKQDRADVVSKLAEVVSRSYYALEDDSIIVNFASTSKVDADFLELFRNPHDSQRAENGNGNGNGASAPQSPRERFAEDERACLKLRRSIALDRAAMFTGVSYDGVCLIGDFRGRPGRLEKVESVVRSLYRLGRVVAAFGKCVDLLRDKLFDGSMALHENHKDGVGICGSEKPAAGLARETDQDAWRDANVVTALVEETSSVERGCQMLAEALTTYEDEARRLGRPVGLR